ncbi:MAG: hypothetical protein ABSF29_14525 [Tepidisphaeraceae bacterium]|jgi:hypothetical protein
MPKTFKHSGDMGDIIFSLPAVRALGGGILYLDPEGGVKSEVVTFNGKKRTKLTAAMIDMMTPVLLQQPYITEVRHWHGEAVDYDLDFFRNHLQYNNLSDSHLSIFGLPHSERDTAWIQVADPIVVPEKPFVISRSVRYHGNYSFWEGSLPNIGDKCVYVGYPKEYEIFVYTFGHEVQYYPTPDILTLARVIAGSNLFISNQGLPHALAEGMKLKLINEVYTHRPSGLFKRQGAQYV